MQPIVKKINELRTLFIIDPLLSDLKCYQCFKRNARVIFQHYSTIDYAPLSPQWVEFATNGHLTQWCLECLFRCHNLDQKTIELIRQNIKDIPSDEQLTQLTQIEEALKKRDLEEQDCCCKRHLRLCCPFDQSSKENPELFSKKLDDEIENKFTEFVKMDNNSSEKIGKWLLWVGDFEDRNKKMFLLINQYYENDPAKRDYWLRLIVYASIFQIKTRCHHVLPKPYSN